MFLHVLPLKHDLKIERVIVLFVPVFVMNNLAFP